VIFLTSGGDGYEIFGAKTTQDTGLPLRVLVVDIIRKKGVVTQGRRKDRQEIKPIEENLKC
jgi:hypothetical protein